jgi:hypothetical protein
MSLVACRQAEETVPRPDLTEAFHNLLAGS